MYAGLDSVATLERIFLPKMNAGAPCPQVVADDSLVLRYLTHDNQIATIRFFGGRSHWFGWPNDEALSGHPLFEAGLESYAFFVVHNSPLIEALEKGNRVHPHHDPKRFGALKHYIITFHDEIFECVAQRYEASTENAHVTRIPYNARIISLENRDELTISNE